MELQRNAMLNRQGRAAWLNSLPDEAVRGLAQSWQITSWKDKDIGFLRNQLAQIEGVEAPLNTNRS
jgi:hypothetical protein